MNNVTHALLGLLLATSLIGTSLASQTAKWLVYMPVSMSDEGTVIKLPKDRTIILAVPCSGIFSRLEKPYSYIARPFAPVSLKGQQEDANLVSLAGIKIETASNLKNGAINNETVTVDLRHWKFEERFIDGVLEHTLECIRRTATDEHQQWPRPKINIVGKPVHKEKWNRWETAFNNQDFSKPFKRPAEPEK